MLGELGERCALTFQRKIVTLQKRALHLIYFSKSKEHTVPFFFNRIAFPYLAYCIYYMISTDRQHQLVYSISLLNQVGFITTEQDLSLATRFMLSSLEQMKCMTFSRIGAQIWNSIPYLNVRPFVKR